MCVSGVNRRSGIERTNETKGELKMFVHEGGCGGNVLQRPVTG